ncbi:MAG TPA: NAD(P)H-dependent oxidoreductase subunit E, partial [Micromonosporaceae bacterium]
MSEARDAFVEIQQRLRRPGPAVLDRLRQVRAERGAVAPDDLDRIATEVGWPVAAVTGSASFYADLAGVRGRRHVRVCHGTACFATTHGRHLDRLAQALGVPVGEAAADRSVSIQAVRCLGFCYAAPAALDGDRPCTGDDLGGLLPATDRLPAGASRDPSPLPPYRNAAPRPVLLAGLLG